MGRMGIIHAWNSPFTQVLSMVEHVRLSRTGPQSVPLSHGPRTDSSPLPAPRPRRLCGKEVPLYVISQRQSGPNEQQSRFWGAEGLICCPGEEFGHFVPVFCERVGKLH